MMEFKITMKEMKDVVKKIEKSVMKKAALPILETVLVKQENNQLAFIASNMEEELHIYKDILVIGNDSFCSNNFSIWHFNEICGFNPM